MSNIDSERLIKHLKEKWKGVPCPYCNSKEWSIDNKIYELREYNDGNFIVGGQSVILPIVPVVCINCGNTVFINPIISKLIGEKYE